MIPARRVVRDRGGIVRDVGGQPSCRLDQPRQAGIAAGQGSDIVGQFTGAVQGFVGVAVPHSPLDPLQPILQGSCFDWVVVMLWCTEAEEHGFLPWFGDLQAARTDSKRPRSSIRLRTVTAIRVSTSWAGRVCERKVSPMMRLYRLIAPSAPALAL